MHSITLVSAILFNWFFYQKAALPEKCEPKSPELKRDKGGNEVKDGVEWRCMKNGGWGRVLHWSKGEIVRETSFWPNANIKRQTMNYKNGKLKGTLTEWDPTRWKTKEEFYSNGKLVRTWRPSPPPPPDESDLATAFPPHDKISLGGSCSTVDRDAEALQLGEHPGDHMELGTAFRATSAGAKNSKIESCGVENWSQIVSAVLAEPSVKIFNKDDVPPIEFRSCVMLSYTNSSSKLAIVAARRTEASCHNCDNPAYRGENFPAGSVLFILRLSKDEKPSPLLTFSDKGGSGNEWSSYFNLAAICDLSGDGRAEVVVERGGCCGTMYKVLSFQENFSKISTKGFAGWAD